MKRAVIISVISLLAAHGSAAQETTTVTVAESDTYGEYLSVDDKPVYLFTTDVQGGGAAEASISCNEECRAAWPLVTTGTSADAEGEAQSDLIGTVEFDNRNVVTYNGWPLYFFARDSEGNPPTGQEIESFGGEWYLIAPGGTRIEGEGA